PLAPAALAGSSDRPGDTGRAVRITLPGASAPHNVERLPIWSCSVRGFACHRPYGRRGALLPHLFTLTRLRPEGFSAASLRGPAAPQRRKARRRAVCFLCHCPSGCPDRGLPGALPCGVRTFLSWLMPAAVVWLAATFQFDFGLSL